MLLPLSSLQTNRQHSDVRRKLGLVLKRSEVMCQDRLSKTEKSRCDQRHLDYLETDSLTA